MGQTLSEPIVEKHSTYEEGERLIYGASSMQGWRISMEDAHTTLLHLPEHEQLSFFAVFDGHGGAAVAKYCGEQLHHYLAQQQNSLQNGDFIAALHDTFLGVDATLKANPEYANGMAGCTAIATLVTPDQRLFISNVGDSRAVLSCSGEAIALSTDHKPTQPQEQQRIQAAGGFVDAGRVNGNLALSRAIGDFEYKRGDLPPEQQIVTAWPDIVERKITPDDEFIIIACDGIWDCMSNQEVVDFCRMHIARGVSLDKICEMIMDQCLAPKSVLTGIGCDNMTLVIVGLTSGQNKADWVAKCQRVSRVRPASATTAAAVAQAVQDRVLAQSISQATAAMEADQSK